MRLLRRSWKQTTATMLKDLKLFSSMCIAQFIVWRTLRRYRKERDCRRKRLSLVHKASAEWREAQNILGDAMLALMFVGLTAAFFLLAIGYVRACEKLS